MSERSYFNPKSIREHYKPTDLPPEMLINGPEQIKIFCEGLEYDDVDWWLDRLYEQMQCISNEYDISGFFNLAAVSLRSRVEKLTNTTGLRYFRNILCETKEHTVSTLEHYRSALKTCETGQVDTAEYLERVSQSVALVNQTEPVPYKIMEIAQKRYMDLYELAARVTNYENYPDLLIQCSRNLIDHTDSITAFNGEHVAGNIIKIIQKVAHSDLNKEERELTMDKIFEFLTELPLRDVLENLSKPRFVISTDPITDRIFSHLSERGTWSDQMNEFNFAILAQITPDEVLIKHIPAILGDPESGMYMLLPYLTKILSQEEYLGLLPIALESLLSSIGYIDFNIRTHFDLTFYHQCTNSKFDILLNAAKAQAKLLVQWAPLNSPLHNQQKQEPDLYLQNRLHHLTTAYCQSVAYAEDTDNAGITKKDPYLSLRSEFTDNMVIDGIRSMIESYDQAAQTSFNSIIKQLRKARDEGVIKFESEYEELLKPRNKKFIGDDQIVDMLSYILDDTNVMYAKKNLYRKLELKIESNPPPPLLDLLNNLKILLEDYSYNMAHIILLSPFDPELSNLDGIF